MWVRSVESLSIMTAVGTVKCERLTLAIALAGIRLITSHDLQVYAMVLPWVFEAEMASKIGDERNHATPTTDSDVGWTPGYQDSTTTFTDSSFDVWISVLAMSDAGDGWGTVWRYIFTKVFLLMISISLMYRVASCFALISFFLFFLFVWCIWFTSRADVTSEVGAAEVDALPGMLETSTLAWYKKFNRCKISRLGTLFGLGASCLTFLPMTVVK